MNRRNIVLTGPGRSGTTLVCHLLNKLPNTVALSEPVPPGKFADLLPDAEAVCDEIERFYRKMRRMARKRGVVVSKHVGGIVPDNTKGFVDGVRSRIADKGKVEVGKELRPGFLLAIKQPGLFTALLPSLAKRFECYAIVRNPLAIMASTGTLQPTKRKNPRATIRYNPELGRRLEENKKKCADRTGQQLLRLHYAFERYQQELPTKHILRYEDIVASNGRALEVLVPAARQLDQLLRNMNVNPLYDWEYMLKVGERLLESEGAYWHFYRREDVQNLLNQIRRQAKRGS